MLRFFAAGTGSEWHSKIRDDDFTEAQKQIHELRARNPAELARQVESIIRWIKSRLDKHDWFDDAAIQVAKEQIGEQLLTLMKSYEIRQIKEGISLDFNINKIHDGMLITQREMAIFEKSVNRNNSLGNAGYYYGYAEGASLFGNFFSSGVQAVRLITGTVGIVLGRIPIISFLFMLAWVASAIVDWVVIGIPYLIWCLAQQVPFSYLRAEIDNGSYVFGNSSMAKESFRAAVRANSGLAEAFSAVLVALWLEFKMIETVRKNRK